MRILFTILFTALPIMAFANDSGPIFGGEASGTFQVAVQTSQVDILDFNYLLADSELICPMIAEIPQEITFDKLAMAKP